MLSKRNAPKPSTGEKLSRFIITLVTFLGGLGFIALLYFPLQHLK